MTQATELKIVIRQIDDLISAEYNPRKLTDDQFEQIKSSLLRFGFVDPIVVNMHPDRTNIIVGGHQRVKVARSIGITDVPTVEVNLVYERERELNIRLNKAVGEWDWDLLKEHFTPEELTGYGFSEKELNFTIDDIASTGLTDPDEVPEPPEVAVTRRGDLYILGDHRLLCGDSTKVEDVTRLMDGNKAILFATDPPYLVDYDGTNHPSAKGEADKNKDWSDTYSITWDDSSQGAELYEGFIKTAIEAAILPEAAWYCWHASRRQMMVEQVWNKFGAFLHQTIIWVKSRPVLTRSWYMWRHEPCFFGWVKGQKPPRRSKDYPHSIWELPTPSGEDRPDHPTPKPVEVFAIPMRQHTKKGEVCYEPFCGGGSQIIAAEQLGRHCFAMEISETYCDVIVERWKNFTGKEPEHIKGPLWE